MIWAPVMLLLAASVWLEARYTGLVWLYLGVVVIAPFLVMVWASIQPFYTVPSQQALGRITFAAYAFPGIGER